MSEVYLKLFQTSRVGEIALKAAIHQFSSETAGTSALHPGQNHRSQRPHFHSPRLFSCTQRPIDFKGQSREDGPADGRGCSSCEASICSPTSNQGQVSIQLDAGKEQGKPLEKQNWVKVGSRRAGKPGAGALFGPGMVFRGLPEA